MTFQHAGDVGDIIYALPTVRALGGGVLALHAERWTREPMTESKVRSLRSLLQLQPYIEDVRWLDEVYEPKAPVNLNDFRADYFRDFRRPDFPKHRNLCEWILRTHDCDPDEQNKQWLQVPPFSTPSVIVNRTGVDRQASHIYRNLSFPWQRIVNNYAGEIAFVGTPHEHADFIQHFGNVPYYKTENLLELAQVIAGADLFIGNQSCAYAIAEGLKKPAILEVCPWLPNCLFHRSDVIHGWDDDIDLPPLTHSGRRRTISGESGAECNTVS